VRRGQPRPPPPARRQAPAQPHGSLDRLSGEAKKRRQQVLEDYISFFSSKLRSRYGGQMAAHRAPLPAVWDGLPGRRPHASARRRTAL
jgi:hypothetical protein